MTKAGGKATKEKYGVDFFRILNRMVQIHKKIKKIEMDYNISSLGTIRRELSEITKKYSSLIRDKQ